MAMSLSRVTLNDVEKASRIAYKNLAPYRVKIKSAQSGDWKVDKFEVLMDIMYLRHCRDGRMPGLGVFTRLLHNSRGIVMSDTNAEIEDLLPYIYQLKGHILISGLGLGMAIKALLEEPTTKSITVIELEKDVIKLVGKSYKDPRVRIINHDTFTWQPDRKFDCAWHDIWDEICSDNLPQMTKLKKHYSKHVKSGQQFCWGERDSRRNR